MSTCGPWSGTPLNATYVTLITSYPERLLILSAVEFEAEMFPKTSTYLRIRPRREKAAFRLFKSETRGSRALNSNSMATPGSLSVA